MKKISILLLSLTALMLTSCEDFLKKEPYGQFTASMIGDSEVEGFVAAAYAGLGAHFFGNNEAFAGPSTNWIFDVRSDDALKGGGDVTMEHNIHLLEISNITSDNVSCLNKWQNNFYAIARVHQAMNAIKESTYPTKDQIIGELKLLRAYYYFDLIRVFERIPYFTETEDPNYVRIDKYSRDQIFAFIKQDIQDAYNVMPAKAVSDGRFSKYVAAALYAKVAAQTSSWGEVSQWADIVIGSKLYSLYDNYLDMSKIAFNNKKESILAIQFSTANNNASINWSNLLHATYSDGNLYGTGDDFFYASQNLADAFRTDDKGLPYLESEPSQHISASYTGNVDPRIDFTMGRINYYFRGHTYTKGWCRAYALYGEYSNKKCMIDPSSPDMVQGWPWGASPLNFCLIRYADILLLKAEAIVEMGGDMKPAIELINQVREKAKRSIDPTYSPVDLTPSIANYKVEPYDVNAEWTQEKARKAVRYERRIELAMEGHRWFDLCRWNNVVEVMNAYFKSEAEFHSYYANANMTSDETFLPTPYAEVNNSHGLYKIEE